METFLYWLTHVHLEKWPLKWRECVIIYPFLHIHMWNICSLSKNLGKWISEFCHWCTFTYSGIWIVQEFICWEVKIVSVLNSKYITSTWCSHTQKHGCLCSSGVCVIVISLLLDIGEATGMMADDVIATLISLDMITELDSRLTSAHRSLYIMYYHCYHYDHSH